MSTLHIVTDSTADVPADVASRLGVTIDPCQVYIGQNVYRDGVDLSPQDLYSRMAGGGALLLLTWAWELWAPARWQRRMLPREFDRAT